MGKSRSSVSDAGRVMRVGTELVMAMLVVVATVTRMLMSVTTVLEDWRLWQ